MNVVHNVSQPMRPMFAVNVCLQRAQVDLVLFGAVAPSLHCCCLFFGNFQEVLFELLAPLCSWCLRTFLFSDVLSHMLVSMPMFFMLGLQLSLKHSFGHSLDLDQLESSPEDLP